MNLNVTAQDGFLTRMTIGGRLQSERLKPCYIQRAEIMPKPMGKYHPKKVSEYLQLDYMGSSEFENGTVAASLRDFMVLLPRCEIYAHPGIKNNKGEPLSFLCYEGQREKVAGWLLELLKEPGYLKEPTYLSRAIYEPSNRFWWDLLLLFAFSFDASALLGFAVAVQNSVEYMDQQKKKK